jgi:hypothetical protein
MTTRVLLLEEEWASLLLVLCDPDISEDVKEKAQTRLFQMQAEFIHMTSGDEGGES